jgi:hypothetical protein
MHPDELIVPAGPDHEQVGVVGHLHWRRHRIAFHYLQADFEPSGVPHPRR